MIAIGTSTAYRLVTKNGTNIIWSNELLRNWKATRISATGISASGATGVSSIAASPTGATQASFTATITTTTNHGFVVGQHVIVENVPVAGYNGLVTIASVPTLSSFTYVLGVSGLAASGTGSTFGDLSVSCTDPHGLAVGNTFQITGTQDNHSLALTGGWSNWWDNDAHGNPATWIVSRVISAGIFAFIPNGLGSGNSAFLNNINFSATLGSVFGALNNNGITVPSTPGVTYARIYMGANGSNSYDRFADVTAIVNGAGGFVSLNFWDDYTLGIPSPPQPMTIFDDTTPLFDIAGASIEIYGPNTSPNSGSAPQFSFGTPINRKVVSVKKLTNVNGQVLRAPNASNVQGVTNIRFVYPDTIQTNDITDDWTKRWAINDIVNVANSSAVDPGGAHGPVALNGAYVVLAVAPDHIVLSNPAAVNANWTTLNTYTGAVSTYGSPLVFSSGPRWVGPFVVNVNDVAELWSNIVAENGLYKDDGTKQFAINVDILLGVTACDSFGNLVGAEVFFRTTLLGSSITRDQRGITLECILPLAGPCSVRAQRITPEDTTFKGTVVDEVKWRDLYAMSPVALTDFGNVTTVQTQTYATEGALSVKQRKLNMIVTRRFPILNPDGSFGVTASTRDAGSILVALATDAFIGGRVLAELDTVGIAAAITAINAYFGTVEASQFCFTFDDGQVSFEESATDIATAIFCTAFRRGKVIGLSFEKKSASSTLLFNHRNKVPKTETRTVTFGRVNEFDGIEYNYVDPISPTYPNIDNPATLYFPTDRSAKNPKKVQSIGVRNFVQATLQGWRLFQRLQFQTLAVQFDSTEEAALCVVNDRILVADNTRQDTQDGEIIDVNVLLITLSQNASLVKNLIAFPEAFDNAVWTKGGSVGLALPVVTPNTQLDPLDKGQRADSIAFPATGVGQESYLQQDLGFVPANGQQWTFSCWIKAAANGNAAIRFVQATGQNDIVVPVPVTTDWQRVSVSGTMAGVGTGHLLARINVLASNPATTIFVFGAQFEAGLVMNDYNPVTNSSYFIFIQHYDGTVESIAITPGPNKNQVILGTAPSIPIVTDRSNWALPTYQIVDNAVAQQNAFLVSECSYKGGKIYTMKAINYDDRYYAHDTDVTLAGLVEPSFPAANIAGYAAAGGYPGDAPTGSRPTDPRDLPDDGGGAGGLGGKGRTELP